MKWDVLAWHVTESRWTARPTGLLATLALVFLLPALWGPALSNSATADEAEPDEEEAAGPLGSVAGRAGYIAFETFGREDSITHAEIMPYIDLDQHTLFTDARLFMSTEGYFGGNVGFGYRYRVPEGNRFLGASFWYDLDDTTSEAFHQLGISLESCGSLWDVRTNLYIPIGDYEKDYCMSVQDQQFVGNQITYTGLRTYGVAMLGYDLEVGIPLPTELARAHNLTITPGSYMFFGDNAEDIYGYKVRAEGNVTDNMAVQLELTDDDTFGTSLTLGIEFVLPGGSHLENPGDVTSRIRTDQFVHRNYNVIVSKQTDLKSGQAAFNPETGEAYNVQHVSTTSSTSSLGTAENPYHTIAEAQAAGGDLIFVHGDSVLTDAIVLQEGEQILGEGAAHYINYDGFGLNLLPTVNSATARPTLLGVSGAAVTLASNSELSGLVIDSATGCGIVGSGVENVVVQDVDILDAGLDGLLLEDTSGENTFYNLTVADALGIGIHIDGGDADAVFAGDLSNSAGRALVVKNTTGGTVDFTDMDVADDGGEGVLLQDADGDVAFGAVNVRNSSTSGLAIDGGSGDYTFDDVSIRAATGAAIDIRNNTGSFAFNELDVTAQTGGAGVSIVDSTADGSFESLQIETDGATGFFVQNAGELELASGDIAATNATAIDIENATVDANLDSVSSSGATVGIRIVDHEGDFLVLGNGEESTGGLISGATTGVLLDNAGTVGLRYMDFDGNGVGIAATDTEWLALSYAQVTNSTNYGLDLLNTEMVEITKSTFEDNGSSTTNTIRFRSDTEGDYGFYLSGSTITDATSGAILIATTSTGADSTLTSQIYNNEITTSRYGAAGLAIDWDGPIVGSILVNEFTGTGDASTGVDITTTSASELAEFALVQNTFAFDGDDSVGMSFTTAGPVTISAETNTIDFDGSGGAGMFFSLAESADVYLTDNVITDNVSGGTGVLFSQITGPSTVTLQGNEIYLLSDTAIIDRGIIFTSITDTVELLDPVNNIVSGATTSFYAPVGALDGYTYVNGETVP